MTKRKRLKTGRVVMVSNDDNTKLKDIFKLCDEIGVALTNSEICDQIFSLGISNKLKSLKDEASL